MVNKEMNKVNSYVLLKADLTATGDVEQCEGCY